MTKEQKDSKYEMIDWSARLVKLHINNMIDKVAKHLKSLPDEQLKKVDAEMVIGTYQHTFSGFTEGLK